MELSFTFSSAAHSVTSFFFCNETLSCYLLFTGWFLARGENRSTREHLLDQITTQLGAYTMALIPELNLGHNKPSSHLRNKQRSLDTT